MNAISAYVAILRGVVGGIASKELWHLQQMLELWECRVPEKCHNDPARSTAAPYIIPEGTIPYHTDHKTNDHTTGTSSEGWSTGRGGAIIFEGVSKSQCDSTHCTYTIRPSSTHQRYHSGTGTSKEACTLSGTKHQSQAWSANLGHNQPK